MLLKAVSVSSQLIALIFIYFEHRLKYSFRLKALICLSSNQRLHRYEQRNLPEQTELSRVAVQGAEHSALQGAEHSALQPACPGTRTKPHQTMSLIHKH